MLSNDETIRRLTQAVTTLTETVAHNEARHQRMRRTVRWLTIVAICVIPLGLYLGGHAVKRAEAASDDTASIAAQLAQLNQIIDQMAQGMGQLMQSPSFVRLIDNGSVLTERLKQDSDAIRFLMFCRMNGLDELGECSKKVQAGMLTLPDGLGLVNASQAPEAEAMMLNITNIEKISQVLGRELRKLNQVLAAVPQMRDEMAVMRHDMNVMSGQMGVMAGSMGSTMGRMGNWMPW